MLRFPKCKEMKGRSESGLLDPGAHVSTGQNIQRKVKV
jgi:hypothetical protein